MPIILYFAGLFTLILIINILMQKIFHIFGGWSKLEKDFTYTQPFIGGFYKWQSIVMNGLKYKGSIHLGISEDGFYIKQVFFIGIFAKPLLIPWEELSYSISKYKNIWGTIFYSLNIKSQPKVVITINEKVLAKLGNRVLIVE